MKWRSLFFLFTCLLMQNLASGEEPISVKKTAHGFQFKCENGQWQLHNNTNLLSLSYSDKNSRDYECIHDEKSVTLTVKFRTCESCIELDAPSLSIIIAGNILATFFVGFAVYSITGQSKSKSFSGNKASDKVNLLTNGEQDTYQPLNPGQTAEYSRLKGGRRT